MTSLTTSDTLLHYRRLTRARDVDRRKSCQRLSDGWVLAYTSAAQRAMARMAAVLGVTPTMQ